MHEDHQSSSQQAAPAIPERVAAPYGAPPVHATLTGLAVSTLLRKMNLVKNKYFLDMRAVFSISISLEVKATGCLSLHSASQPALRHPGLKCFERRETYYSRPSTPCRRCCEPSVSKRRADNFLPLNPCASLRKSPFWGRSGRFQVDICRLSAQCKRRRSIYTNRHRTPLKTMMSGCACHAIRPRTDDGVASIGSHKIIATAQASAIKNIASGLERR